MKNKFPKTILITFLLIRVIDTTAQNAYDFHQLGEETVNFAKQPFEWKGKELLILAAIGGGTFGLMQIDEAVRDEMLLNRDYVKSIPMEFGRYWGEPLVSIAFSAAFLIHGITSDNLANKKLGYEIGQSFLYTGGVTVMLKNLFGRSRPYMGRGAFSFYPFHLKSYRYWSLPSGHTSLAFSLSTVLSKNLDSDALKAAAFLPAVLTAFSRVYNNYHWVSDVFLGAALGYFIGEYVTELHNKKTIISIQPNYDNILNLSFAF